MSNLDIEDFKQINNFYKQRANELEFTVLQNQLIIQKLNNQNASLQSKNDSLDLQIKNLNEKIGLLSTQVSKTKKVKKKTV